jgi:hypothetical protein
MAVVATMTRGTVISGVGSEFWSAGVDGISRKESIKILLWHLYVGVSMESRQNTIAIEGLFLNGFHSILKCGGTAPCGGNVS